MKLLRSTGVFLVEALYRQGSILYIGGWFPGALMFFVSLPVYQILELSSINTGSYNIVHFIFLIALFRDMNWPRLGHRLTRKRS